jgi:DNA-binding NtrC family response regulator
MNKTKYLQHFLKQQTRNDFMDNLPTLEILKAEYIRYLLELTDFDIQETAKILDIPPSILRKVLNRSGIEYQNTIVH